MNRLRYAITFFLVTLLISIGLINLYSRECHPISSKVMELINDQILPIGLLLLIEVIALFYDYIKYSFLKGKYKRIIIYEKLKEPINDSFYSEIERYKGQDFNNGILLKYIGNGIYHGKAKYEEGDVKLTVSINKENLKTGEGSYEYIFKKQGYKMPDMGTYYFQLQEFDNEKIYVYYKNMIPSGLAEGYEIWEKI